MTVAATRAAVIAQCRALMREFDIHPAELLHAMTVAQRRQFWAPSRGELFARRRRRGMD